VIKLVNNLGRESGDLACRILMGGSRKRGVVKKGIWTLRSENLYIEASLA